MGVFHSRSSKVTFRGISAYISCYIYISVCPFVALSKATFTEKMCTLFCLVHIKKAFIFNLLCFDPFLSRFFRSCALCQQLRTLGLSVHAPASEWFIRGYDPALSGCVVNTNQQDVTHILIIVFCLSPQLHTNFIRLCDQVSSVRIHADRNPVCLRQS